MRKRPLLHAFFFTLISLIALTACSIGNSTKDWSVFAIEEEPAIDIQFRLPPDWYVDYAPLAAVPGQWDVALVPPRCSEDQEKDFADNCITLTIHTKDISNFDQKAYLASVGRDMLLTETGSEKTMLMSKNILEVDDLTIQRFNHKFYIGEDEVQLSFLFFETDSAYYSFAIELPYDERDGDVADLFNKLVGSIEETN